MKMTANEVIESYVTDVALQLQRKQRNDVAFELRALINEGLQDKADAASRVIDTDMAIEFCRGFGPPEEVAARYRQALTIIDPADGQRFLRATIIGLLIIWAAGLFETFSQPLNSSAGFFQALGHWWGSTLIPSMWWPGVLVVGFGLSSWVGQRWPNKSEWKPRASDRIYGGRTAMVMGVMGIVCGIYILFDPRWVLDFFWNGNAAPVAYEALTYTKSFLQLQAPILFLLLLLNIPLYMAVIVKGRWTKLLRRIETALALLNCVVMVWTITGGPIFMSQQSDGFTKLILLLIVLFSLLMMTVEMYRSVKPEPGEPIQVQ